MTLVELEYPKIERIEGDDRYAKFACEPLPPGYGTTLGNSLRRVLLSSLPGAAITAARVRGVAHEFSTIPGVKEDVVQIVLNLKQIRLRSFANEPVTLTLEKTGPGDATAADIMTTSEIEIVNPEAKIATLEPDASLWLELTVETGRGFHSADRRDGSAEEQLERFLGAVSLLPRRPPLLHVANSAAALRDRRFGLDLVRPGVYLYGGAPAEWIPGGRPVVSIRARVVSVRTVRRGETVSYHATWTAPRDTIVATLGIGYADGLRRALGLGGQAYVLLRGARCPVVGLVTMDYVMVETGGTAVEVGDVATLVGEADGGRIALDQFAAWSGELQREFLTGLGSRLTRVYE